MGGGKGLYSCPIFLFYGVAQFLAKIGLLRDRNWLNSFGRYTRGKATFFRSKKVRFADFTASEQCKVMPC
jgi:hypothetical protein